MTAWTPDIDPSTIPDEVLLAERARRNARKRATYTGGLFWRKHNPEAANCRCEPCMAERHPDLFKAAPRYQAKRRQR